MVVPRADVRRALRLLARRGDGPCHFVEKAGCGESGVLGRRTVHSSHHIDDFGDVQDRDPQRPYTLKLLGDLGCSRVVEEKADHGPRVEDYSP